MNADTIETTLQGAIILGIPLAMMFSGVLIVECLVYWRSVKVTDTWRMSCIVLALLVLDTIHSSVLMASSWEWFITDHGMNADFIPTTMALSILISGISILIVHSMYSWRIFQFSKQKYWLTLPIMVLAVFLFILTCLFSAHMIQLKSFEEIRHSHAFWVFGTIIGLSCAVNALITVVMMIILRRRAQSVSVVGVVDTLIVYTLETGLATGIATLAMLITWLALQENPFFPALHSIIHKLYANSLVAMLNNHSSHRQQVENTTSRSIDAVDLNSLGLKRNTSQSQRRGRLNYFSNTRNQMHASSDDDSIAPVEVNVTKTMQIHVDDSLMNEPTRNGGSKAMSMSLMDTESAHSQY